MKLPSDQRNVGSERSLNDESKQEVNVARKGDFPVTIAQLETQLRDANKFWMYESRLVADMSEDHKKEIARHVLAAPRSWVQGLAESFS